MPRGMAKKKKVLTMKGKIGNLDFINIQDFWSSKSPLRILKGKPETGRKYSQHISDKRLLSIIYKEFI